MKYSIYYFLAALFSLGCGSGNGIAEKASDSLNDADAVQIDWRPYPYTVFETDSLGSSGERLENVEVTIFNEQDVFEKFYREIHGNEDGIIRDHELIENWIIQDGVDESSFAWQKEADEQALERSGKLDFIELDFSRGSVLFIDLGSKNTTGYEIHIKKIDASGDNTYLHLRNLSPGKGCIVGDAFTRPYVLAFVHAKIDTIEPLVVSYTEVCKYK